MEDTAFGLVSFDHRSWNLYRIAEQVLTVTPNELDAAPRADIMLSVPVIANRRAAPEVTTPVRLAAALPNVALTVTLLLGVLLAYQIWVRAVFWTKLFDL